jgi:hypothetical protein
LVRARHEPAFPSFFLLVLYLAGSGERGTRPSEKEVFIRFEGKELSARAFDKDRRVSQGAIVENKLLGAALQHIREQQAGQQEARLASAKTKRDKRLARKKFVGSGSSSCASP